MQQSIVDLYDLYELLDDDTAMVVKCISTLTSWEEDNQKRLKKAVENLEHKKLHKYVTQILDMNYGIIRQWKKEYNV